jgi:phosphatidylglycerophosphate synthase
MADIESRRPLAARDWKIIQQGARWLSRRNVTPNQISIFSIVFAALAGACLVLIPESGARGIIVLALLAILFILGRALCNVFDGMIAIEGGKKTRSGELFNDIPDRIADTLILVAAGYATEIVAWAPIAGWCAALFAVATAYVRTLARSIGAPPDFRGPMAKVSRMALISAACLVTPIEGYFWPQGMAIVAALILIVAGCAITMANRARAAYLYLERETDA